MLMSWNVWMLFIVNFLNRVIIICSCDVCLHACVLVGCYTFVCVVLLCHSVTINYTSCVQWEVCAIWAMLMRISLVKEVLGERFE